MSKFPTPNDFKIRSMVPGPACKTNLPTNSLDTLLNLILMHIERYIKGELGMLNHHYKKIIKQPY